MSSGHNFNESNNNYNEDDFFESLIKENQLENREDDQLVDELYVEDGEFLNQATNDYQYNAIEDSYNNQENEGEVQETNLEFLRDQTDPESFFDQLSINKGNEVPRESIDTTEHEEFLPNDDSIDDDFQVSDYELNPFNQSEILKLGEQELPEEEEGEEGEEEEEYEPLPQDEEQLNSRDSKMDDNDSLFNESPPDELESTELERLLDENDKPNQEGEDEEVEIEEPEKEVDSKSIVDDLFTKENEDEFLQALGEKKENVDEIDSTVDKLAALDLTLDDDLLLDEEFLDELQPQQPQQQVPQSQQQPPVKDCSKYAPSSNKYTAPLPTQNQTNQQEFVQNLEKSKKKNDAYDFPDGLLTNKVRPAPRHTPNKYAPSSVGNSQSTISTLASNTAIHANANTTTSSAAPPPPPPASSNNLIKSSSSLTLPQEKTIQPKKSFFEELPGVELPKAKTARKPAPVKSVNKFHPMSPVQRRQSVTTIGPTVPPKTNKSPPVNPYKPKSGASPIFQQHIPTVGHTGIAKPNVNASNQNNYAAAPPSSLSSYSFPPSGNLAPPKPQQHYQQPQQQQQQQQQQQPEDIPPTNQKSYAPIASAPVNSNSQAGRKISNTVNTNLGKNSPSNNSPYVPNAGPYAPSNQPKAHSRAGSLVGGKGGKEVNPYAPVLSTVPSNGSPQLKNQQPHPQQQPKTHAMVPPPGRVRGFSNAKGNIYKAAPKIVNPEGLAFRQFPIFNWSIAENVVLVKPNATYGAPVISVEPIKTYCKDQEIYLNFPGPLSKGKSKKKDILNWFEVSSNYLQKHDYTDELLLNNILMQLVKNDGDLTSDDCLKQICLILNPNVNFNVQDLPVSGGTTNGYKLDNSGINTVFALIQAGDISKALEYSISRNDWALALVLANFSGPESFAKIASEYARNTFPFSKANNKVLHIMPILLKVIGGNVQGVIQDLTNVSNEGDYANLHWKDIISSVAISGSLKTKEFLIEFGKFLIGRNNLIGGEIAFIIAGLPFGQQGFMAISSGHHSMYTQIYEYILNLSTPSQFPHLLPIKIKHASTLADYGLINESQKYIDTINSNFKSLGSKSPFVNQQIIQEFQNLIMRLSELGSSDTGGWFGGKMSKVNLDKVWGQIDKFIVGGEEAKPKTSENGVFSKFSPSVSRNASTLDLGTLQSYTSPSMRGAEQFERNRPTHPSTSFHHPGLDASMSTTSVSKYAPASLKNSPFQSQTNDRYAPHLPNNSSQSNLIDSSNSIFQQPHHQQLHHSKPQSPLAQKAPYPYNNPLGPISTSSIGSIPPANVQPHHVQGHGQQNSISSVLSGESMINGPLISTQSGALSHVETIKESPELKAGSQLPQQQEQSKEQDEVQELENEPITKFPPPIKKTKSAPPTARSNPYAPSTNSKPKARRSKYGPPTIGAGNNISELGNNSPNKYGPSSTTNSYAPSIASNYAPSIDQKLPEPEPEVLDEFDSTNTSHQTPPSKSSSKQPPQLPQLPPQQEPNQLKPMKNIPNIDDSFDHETSIIEPESTNILQTPKPNLYNLNPGLYNSTFQSTSNGLDGFPIPGSPEFTTRANSVYGGATNPNVSGTANGGFFSSRLSQFQQSAMYQQYEVQDDTVRDYVPILEEDEDDEEDQRKKEEEERKVKEEAKRDKNANQSQKQQSQKHQQHQKDGWFNNWLSKNDGKPKPIRAKLGEKVNPFYYDEKHKRWLDRTKPIEEQLKAGQAPPPPPSAKKKPTTNTTTNNNSNSNSNASAPPPIPPTGSTATPSLKPSLPPSSSGSTKPTPNKSNLANAGIDDLLSMSETSLGTNRKNKRAGRRNYINVNQ
ncbi:SEC16 [Candida jiufengensis]|uniref:SEC16 n=1 Tax=Candida jiufengensis TaxID=497108 RepID=UPI0022250682|nr:SEC16 [Candida jiufengensis]KAI5956597.1 SEC16 [Candida jiufengensis]